MIYIHVYMYMNVCVNNAYMYHSHHILNNIEHIHNKLHLNNFHPRIQKSSSVSQLNNVL